MIVGLFRRSAKGFGFVRPHGAGRGIDQIYIPPEATRDASSGDEVAVKITRPARRGGLNAEGRIVEVLTRAAAVFVGTYFEAGDTSFVKVDGTTFHDPISVGDPGAKGARPGDKVALEIVRYPTPYHEGEGVITEILGQRGQPGVDTLTVIRAFNIPDTFDDAALDEAREQAQLFDEAEIGTRLDLRGLLTVTIDPATARDFDDAISLSRDENGPLEPGRPHRRRLALRPPRLAARPRRPDSRHERLPARPRDPDASRDPLEQPGQPPGRPHAVHRERPPGVQPRGHPDREAIRPLGDQGRPSLHLRAGAAGHEAARRCLTPASPPRSPRCWARCSSWR